MPPAHRTIPIHPDAPAKPAPGATCNGCGVCCLAEPCPVGVVLSRRRHGACSALQWVEFEGRYACGALLATRGDEEHAPLWRRGLRRLLARWIAAGVGCDCTLDVEHVATRPD